MGLAVAKSFASRENWEIHILDLNSETGKKAATELGSSSKFHQCNILKYEELAATFKSVFLSHNRLDFVFANAGIAERDNFYRPHDTGIEPPPAPNTLCVEILLTAVITTSYLAQHYFRQSPAETKGQRNLVITASCGGIYPSRYSPIYSAAKHGCVGFTRSIAKHFYNLSGVRVNAICPGTVKTGLLSATEWSNFPEANFTPVEKIVETVEMFVDGKEDLWGKAALVSGRNHYFTEQPEWCDESMRITMEATDAEELEIK